MSVELFYNSERTRVSKLFNKNKHKGFKDKSDLADWFVQKLKNISLRFNPQKLKYFTLRE